MLRKLVSIILVVFVISTVFSIARVATVIDGHVIDGTTWGAKDIKVGAYYYPWYSGNWTKDHSNCPDTPVLENYNSSEPSLIQDHLEWFTELDLDFLIISWWGINSLSDNNTKILFSEVQKNSVVELAIMIEPFGEGGEPFDETTGEYNYSKIYDYIYDNFVEPYGGIYMNLQEHPLVCFYNDANLTKDGNINEILTDGRFIVRIVGHRHYVDWLYWRIPECAWSDETDSALGTDGHITVIPRYDDDHFRSEYPPVYDSNYTDGLYDNQWNTAIKLAREGKVNIVTITSWNEYAERTMIEPTNDTTSAYSDPYWLFKNTKEYINILKGIFPFFMKEIFETVGDIGENQCRYNATDDRGFGLDTIKIIENPESGYIGVYHSNVSQILEVRLANSTDLLNWTFMWRIDREAAQPTIAKAPNDAYIIVYEKKELSGLHHLRFQYYSNLSDLINNSSDATYDASRTLSDDHEGTPNIYNVTIRDTTLSACVGFHYYNGSVDNAAAGWLTIPLDNPQNMVWNNTKPLTGNNQNLRDKYQVRGNIGGRDYGHFFGRNFTLQEGNLEERLHETNWTAWRIFLYDHSTGNFRKLSITTHFNATSFGNPTFTLLKSSNNKSRIVVTYFLFSEGLPDGYKDKAGELSPLQVTHWLFFLFVS